MPELDWLKKYVPDHIGHKYAREMTRKSEIVSIVIVSGSNI